MTFHDWKMAGMHSGDQGDLVSMREIARCGLLIFSDFRAIALRCALTLQIDFPTVLHLNQKSRKWAFSRFPPGWKKIENTMRCILMYESTVFNFSVFSADFLVKQRL